MKKKTRFMLCSDVHGAHRDEDTVSAALHFARIFKPTIRVEMGDLCDLACLRLGCSPSEKVQSLEDDLDAGLDFLDKFKPTVKLDGNHEDRVPRLMAHPHEEIRFAAKKLNSAFDDACARLHCRRLPYDAELGIYQLGNLSVVHGFGRGGANMCREHAIGYGPVACGHGHRIEEYIVPSRRQSRRCNMIGCMCNIRMEWDKARIGALSQQHGWGYGFVDLDTGDYELYQARRIGGKWYVPTEFAQV